MLNLSFTVIKHPSWLANCSGDDAVFTVSPPPDLPSALGRKTNNHESAADYCALQALDIRHFEIWLELGELEVGSWLIVIFFKETDIAASPQESASMDANSVIYWEWPGWPVGS